MRMKAVLLSENMLLRRSPHEFPKKTSSIRAARKMKNISAVFRNLTAQKMMRVKMIGVISWKGTSMMLFVK